MSKSSVYLETSFISFLLARPSRDILVLSMQQASANWWSERRDSYHTFISDAVINEVALGDANQAKARLKFIEGIPVLEFSEDVQIFSSYLLEKKIIPTSSYVDAIHIAYAAVNGIEFILTWNFKHLANPDIEKKVYHACLDYDFDPPLICTPFQFFGGQNNE